MRPDPLPLGRARPAAAGPLRFEIASDHASVLQRRLDARLERVAPPAVEALSLWDTESAEDHRRGTLLAVLAGLGGRWWPLATPEESDAKEWMDLPTLARQLDDPTGFAAVRFPIAEQRSQTEVWRGRFAGQETTVRLRRAPAWPSLPLCLRLEATPDAGPTLERLRDEICEGLRPAPAESRVDQLCRTLGARAVQALGDAESGPSPGTRWKASHDLNYLLSRQRGSEAVPLRRAARYLGAERLDELLRRGDVRPRRPQHPLWQRALEVAWPEGAALPPWEHALVEALHRWRRPGSPRPTPSGLQVAVVMLGLQARRTPTPRLDPLLELLLKLANQAARWERWRALDAAFVDLAASESLRGETDAVLALGALRHRLRARAMPARAASDEAWPVLRRRRWRKLRRALPFLEPALAPES